MEFSDGYNKYYKDSSNSFTINTQHHYMEEVLLKRNYSITKIKRLSDAEVFTIGDTIKHNTTNDIGKISGIHLTNENLYFSTDYCNSIMGTRLDNCKKLEILLTTEDGVDIFKGDDFWEVINNTNRPYYVFSKYVTIFIENKHNRKAFSTKEAADNYILINKPCLSFNDVWNISNDKPSDNKYVIIEKKKLKELAKSKL